MPRKKVEKKSSVSRLLNSQPLTVSMQAIGDTGLRRFGGYIFENSLSRLNGLDAMRIYKEMGETDPSCATVLFLISNVIRGVDWHVRPASQKDRDVEAALFVESCMNDMEVAWSDTLSEHLSMIQYGYSLHEIVYKRRTGRASDPWMRSKYADGRIGWRCLDIRSQDTIQSWEFDDSGSLIAAIQNCTLAGTGKGVVRIPMSQALLFRTSVHKGNPEGESALRRCHRSWYIKRGIENVEAVGVERDLAGYPVAYVDASYLSPDADDDMKETVESLRRMTQNVRRDKQEGMVFPLAYNDQGKLMFDFKLLNSGGTRQYDTSKIIDRYNLDIFRTAMMDFLTLGQGSSSGGSYAMHVDKASLFTSTLKTYLAQICDQYNRVAIPRLMEANGFILTDYPELAHSSVEQRDLDATANTFRNLVGAGLMQVTPEIETYIAEMFGLPRPVDQDRKAKGPAAAINTLPSEQIEIKPGQEMIARGYEDKPTILSMGQQNPAMPQVRQAPSSV